MSDSPVDRFKRWMESEGLTHREAAKRLGCDATYPSMIISRGRVGLDVAVRIEEETAGFAEGPIKCGEWVRHSETVATSEPAREVA